ncbi:MAG: nicotinamide-nucleotide amidohydrolase family protein [Erysipelothrix sp.]|nr:nicotinamide-nucleotide amidohydrolase family protein [Erysipelothrix sp.]
MTTLHDLCIKHQITLACAESMTGGAFSASITQIANASRYFLGGIVTYSTQSKIDLLNIPKELIEEHSVYSLECAEAMALGVKQKFNSQLSIAISGEAGHHLIDDYQDRLIYSCIVFNDRIELFKDSCSGLRNVIIRESVELLHQRCISIIERGYNGKE